jgi:hypothetical protein
MKLPLEEVKAIAGLPMRQQLARRISTSSRTGRQATGEKYMKSRLILLALTVTILGVVVLAHHSEPGPERQSSTARSSSQSGGLTVDRSKLPAGSTIYEGRDSIYIGVPLKMSWPDADAWAKRFDSAHRSNLAVFGSRSEFDEVMRGLKYPSVALYWVGYHRYTPFNQSNLRAGWKTVTGEPMILSIWNSSGPDGGCKKKFKPGGVEVRDGEVTASILYGEFCKPQENSACIWTDRGGMLEDVSQNHSQIRGLVVEIPRR